MNLQDFSPEALKRHLTQAEPGIMAGADPQRVDACCAGACAALQDTNRGKGR